MEPISHKQKQKEKKNIYIQY